MDEAIAVLSAQGAVIVDPADIPSVVDDRRRPTTFLRCGICSGTDDAKGKDADCSVVFKYGMKRDFNAWLASLGDGRAGEDADRAARMEHRHAKAGAIKYGQSQLDISDEMDLEADRARYEADRAKDLRARRARTASTRR